MKEYTKEELFKMNAIDVYKIILDDEANKRFPNGFWNGLLIYIVDKI